MACNSAINETFQQRLGDKLALIEELRAMNLAQEGISLPGVVVCGNQSAGKSSVLESITGINFPRAQNTCTRCPTVVSLVTSPAANEVQVQIDSSADFNNAKFTDLASVGEEISRLTTELAESGGISKRPIYIKVIRREGPVMTLIDLPGITHVAVGDMQDGVHDVTAGLVDEYVLNDNMVVLVVIPATDDFGNCEALRIAGQHDPHGLRTLGVISKIDNVPNDSDIVDKMKMTRESDVKLNLGYVAIRNRSPAEAKENLPIEDVLSKESQLFKTHPLLRQIPPEMCGQKILVQRIVDIQSQRVDEHFPKIKQLLDKKLGKTRNDLRLLPGECLDAGARRQKFSRMTNGLTLQLGDLVKATDSSNDKTIHVSARIRELSAAFFESFFDTTHVPDFLGEDFRNEIADDMNETRGYTLDNFMSDPVLRRRIHSVFFEGYLHNRCHDFVSKVHDLMERVLNRLVSDHFGKVYRALCSDVRLDISRVLEDRRQQTMERVDALLDDEKEVLFTQDTFYVETLAAMRQVHEQDKDLPWVPEAVRSFFNYMQENKENTECTRKHEWEMQLSLHCYSKILQRRLGDVIPIIIRAHLVEKFLKELPVILYELYDEAHLERTMNEPPDVASKRRVLKNTETRCVDALKAMRNKGY